jgi:hypothetical protein
VVIDYEAAWTELAQHIASKTQHGREPLLTEMAHIAARSRVEAGELPRVLRLYGVEVARAAVADISPAEGSDLAVGFDSTGDRALAGHHGPGGHDECSNGRTAGAAG